MPHSSYEIAVCCRYTFFSCCHNTHMSTHTRSTAWCVDCTSCVYEDFQKAFSDTLFVDLLCCRNDHNTYIRMNSMSLKNGSCFSHIFHSSVCTGSDHDLIDRQSSSHCPEDAGMLLLDGLRKDRSLQHFHILRPHLLRTLYILSLYVLLSILLSFHLPGIFRSWLRLRLPCLPL